METGDLHTQAEFLDRQVGLASLTQLGLVLCCGYHDSIICFKYLPSSSWACI